MTTRTLGRLGRILYSCEAWPSASNSSVSQSSSGIRASAVCSEAQGDVRGSSACDQILAKLCGFRSVSCLRRIHTECWSVPSASCRDNVCWTNSAGGLALSRSFASKAKKLKSRNEETVEVDEDVSAIAKDSATKMMEMALDVLAREHAKLRTGRASSGMLDHITVAAHGVRTPLNHIAAVSVAGLQTLNVLPYDPSMVKEVEKALLMSPLGLNPVVDGSILTVPLPRLTKEVCESMCKLAVKAGEAAKLSIRRARKDALDRVRVAGLSKDAMKRFEKEVEELTKKYIKSTDEFCKRKEKEIF